MLIDSLLENGESMLANSPVGAIGDFTSKALNPIYWMEQNRADNISAENRQFQREMTEKSYELAFKNWLKEFDIEKDWNKATNQVSQLRAAGVNPAVNQAAMNGTINMPSAVGGHATAPQAFEGVSHSDTSFLNAAKGINSSILNEDTKDLINSEIKANLAKAKLDDVYTSLNDFALQLQKEFGRSEYKAKVDNLIQDLAVKVQDIALSKEQAADFTASAMLKMLQGPLLSLKRSMDEVEYQKLQKELEVYSEKLRTDINLSKASANAANATAANQRAQAITENEFREIEREILGYKRDIVKVQKDVTNRTAMNQALENLENTRWVNKKLVEDVRRMYKENRYKDVMEILRCINLATDSYLDLSQSGFYQTESINNLLGGFMSRSKSAAVRNAAKGIYTRPTDSYHY